nr:PrgI family protein [uncultured Caproiciproducens sp.]
MPYVPVPKDLTMVKTKVVLNLTKRQLICFSIAGLIGFPTYLITRQALGITGAALVMVAAVLPCFLFAMYEKDGQPLERILKNMLLVRFFSPKVRPYQTNNLYAALERQNKLDKEVERMGLLGVYAAVDQKTDDGL